MDDVNDKVIAEFRANEGRVGGHFERMRMVLVTHRGAKSGIERTTPLVCSLDGDRVVLIASMGGAPKHPAWYFNLVAHPEVTVELGTETYRARAVEVHDDERRRLYDAQAAEMPFFAEYEQKAAAHRTIPVFVLERLAA